nr:tyrosine-type recombinase/integrase [Burkholderia sp. Ac-20384]
MPSGESRVRWINRDEASALVLEAGRCARRPHLPNFIRLALNTGCCKNELLRLDRSRVDFERACFRLDGVHTKNRKRRLVPLNDVALSALRAQRE